MPCPSKALTLSMKTRTRMGSPISTNGAATPIPPTRNRTRITPQNYTLISATEEPFPYIFASRTEDTFGINDIDQNEPTQFLKVGDIIRGTDFKIIKFTEKKESTRHEGGRIGVAARTPAEPCAGHPCERKIAISPQSVATFVYTWGGRREFEVRKDQEFSLKPQEEIKYKLIEVRPDKAVIAKEPKTRCADRDRLREPVKLTQRSRRTQSKISYPQIDSLVPARSAVRPSCLCHSFRSDSAPSVTDLHRLINLFQNLWNLRNPRDL